MNKFEKRVDKAIDLVYNVPDKILGKMALFWMGYQGLREELKDRLRNCSIEDTEVQENLNKFIAKFEKCREKKK